MVYRVNIHTNMQFLKQWSCIQLCFLLLCCWCCRCLSQVKLDEVFATTDLQQQKTQTEKVLQGGRWRERRDYIDGVVHAFLAAAAAVVVVVKSVDANVNCVLLQHKVVGLQNPLCTYIREFVCNPMCHKVCMYACLQLRQFYFGKENKVGMTRQNQLK